jgi:hypothetical protein
VSVPIRSIRQIRVQIVDADQPSRQSITNRSFASLRMTATLRMTTPTARRVLA